MLTKKALSEEYDAFRRVLFKTEYQTKKPGPQGPGIKIFL